MGGRNLTPEMSDASRARVVRPVMFVRLDLDSGPLRVTDLSYDFAWDEEGGTNPKTWLGTRGLGKITRVQTGVENRAYGVSMTMSGIPKNERLALALSEPVQGREAWVWRGMMDAGHRLIPSPKIWFGGWIDTMNAKLGLATASITVNLFNDLIDWERSQGERYNDACQQARFPGDTFFKLMPDTANATLVWGREYG